MYATHQVRPRFTTRDYSDTEETDPIFPLRRRLTRARVSATKKAPLILARPRTPLIVDKRQLVDLLSVVYRTPEPGTLKARVPRLSALVRDERVIGKRRRRQHQWLSRIAFLALLELAAVASAQPTVNALFHHAYASVVAR